MKISVAAFGAGCSEWLFRAHSVNSLFVLRALAAPKLRRERKTRHRFAAGNAAIRTVRGIVKWSGEIGQSTKMYPTLKTARTNNKRGSSSDNL